MYPAYPDRCGFNALLPARAPRPPATGDIRARYAVIGAGYTGLAAARRLAELDPDARIVLLEAGEIGEGASARNSGFASPRDIPASTDPAELAATARQNRLTEEGWDWLMAQCDRHAIECGLVKSGRIKGAATDLGEAAVRGLYAAVQAQGVPHHLLDRAALQSRIGTAYYQAGLWTEEGYLLDPAALVRGLARALPENVALHERSPVLRLHRRDGWVAETATASIRAEAVILATNAATRKFGFLRDRLVTIYTYAALSAPVAPGALGDMPVWGLLPSHRLGTTVRRVGPDRLLVRSMYAHERPLPAEQVHDTLLSCFHRRYPALSGIGLDHAWGGTTALTMNGAPWWGQLEAGLYASAGCNGSGIVKGTVLGKRLAERIAGHGDHADVLAAYGQANWVAPEPFRSIGFAFIAARERRKAGAEA